VIDAESPAARLSEMDAQPQASIVCETFKYPWIETDSVVQTVPDIESNPSIIDRSRTDAPSPAARLDTTERLLPVVRLPRAENSPPRYCREEAENVDDPIIF
jgi:hypothetical protein